MAVITNIRNNKILLFFVIGTAMVLFVLSELFNPGAGGAVSRNIGEVAGQEITAKEFEQKVQDRIAQYKENTGQLTLPAELSDQIRDQVWTEIEEEHVLIKPAQALGLGVSAAELNNLIFGQNPHQIIKQNFTDPKTGQFNPQQVRQVMNTLLEDDEKSHQWINLEQSIKKDRAVSKYYGLLQKGLYVTKAQKNQEQLYQNTKAKIAYTLKRYTDVLDTDVSYTEAELKDYYQNNKQKQAFKQTQEERSISYVSFPIQATAEDSAENFKNMATLKEKFLTTTADTAFVQSYANKTKQIKYATKKTIAPELDSVVFSMQNGQVRGPIYDPLSGAYNLVKLLEVKFGPDSVKASHILIPIQNADTATAQLKADSLIAVAKSGTPFAILAMQHSQDQGTKDKGGDLGWFQEGQMLKSLNDACFNGKKGDVVSVISNYGLHIVNITEQTQATEKRLIAQVDRYIQPSKYTQEEAYNKASAFSINTENDAAAFDTKANEMGMRQADRIKKTDKQISGLGEHKELLKWIYTSEKDAVSEPTEFENQIIVAKLSDIRAEGTLDFETMKEFVQTEVIKAKKAEKIKAMQNGSNLSAIANAWQSSVDTAQSISFSSFSIPGIGNEFAVIGGVFSMQKNQAVKTIPGEFGVYAVEVLDLVSEETPARFSATQSSYQRRLSTEALKALKESAGVEDMRLDF